MDRAYSVCQLPPRPATAGSDPSADVAGGLNAHHGRWICAERHGRRQMAAGRHLGPRPPRAVAQRPGPKKRMRDRGKRSASRIPLTDTAPNEKRAAAAEALAVARRLPEGNPSRIEMEGGGHNPVAGHPPSKAADCNYRLKECRRKPCRLPNVQGRAADEQPRLERHPPRRPSWRPASAATPPLPRSFSSWRLTPSGPRPPRRPSWRPASAAAPPLPQPPSYPRHLLAPKPRRPSLPPTAALFY